MQGAIPIKKEIVLIGGGHAHLAVLKQFGMRPLPGVRLTLISPNYDTPYSGMLPGYLAGHYSFAESHINLLPLCQFARAQFYRDTVVGLDLDQRKIECQQHPPVAFDIVSINTGSTPAVNPVPGAANHVIPIKPVEKFLQRWAEIEAELEHTGGRTLHFVVAGAGAGGVELALSLQHRLEKRRSQQTSANRKHRFSLVTASSTILPTHNRQVQKSYRQILAERNIDLHTNQRITEVLANRIYTHQKKEYYYDYLLWVTNASTPPWPKTAGLAVDELGFISVNDCLQSTSHPCVFAAGDIASMIAHQRPKSGVFAVRQGRTLARNLRAIALGQSLIPYAPQRHFLSLISTGDQFAVASRGRWSMKGKWVWKWKDWIDRRWLQGYQVLPKMDPGNPANRSQPPHPKPGDAAQPEARCTGCGSKVGHKTLNRVLQRIDITQNPLIRIGLEPPDDAAVFSTPESSPVVQTVDFFPSLINDPFLSGQITTIHCLSDIVAMGATPLSAQIIAMVPYGNERTTEESLFQLMSGAVKALNAHQTPLIGGHTLEGEQFAMGMTVNGYMNSSSPLMKQGLKPGDQLILTKPIGTGMIFAALMKQKCVSQWIAETVEEMLRSNAAIIPLLRQYDVASATDLTGFGLIGHLAEIMEASRVDAILDINAIPLLNGAVECAREGILSSLHPQNHQRHALIINDSAFRSDRRYPALFDPQTSGGLLFGIHADHAAKCLEQIHQTGSPRARIIGRVTAMNAQRPQLTLTR